MPADRTNPAALPAIPADRWRLKLYRGTWCAVGADDRGRTRRRALGTADRAAAGPAFQDFLHNLTRRAAPADPLVGAILDAYAAELAARQVPAAGRVAHALKPLKRHFADKRPEHVDRAAAQAYADARRRAGAGDGTIHTELGYLGTALRWAWRERWIPEPRPVWRPAKPPPRDRWLTPPEAERLLEAAGAAHLRLFILLALHTAARATAILELTWPQVNDRFIDFNLPGRPRTGKSRAVVPVTPTLRAALDMARQAATGPQVVDWGGLPLRSVKKAFAAAAARAGLDGVSPHVLRHTAATWMAKRGVPMSRIARYLGHRDSRTTERVYAKHSPDWLADAAAAIEAEMHTASLVHLNQKTGTSDEHDA